MGRTVGVAAVALVLALVLAPLALADPPANDNRAAAEAITAFPAAIQGTTVGATLERLDPQVGECGAVESTVWYRIDAAPDGLIRIAVKGPGFAPALRVYRVNRSAIGELDCANAAAGAAASVSFQSVRGASYLVLVGNKPGTAQAAFELDADVFLPPSNDRQRGAVRIKKVPVTVKGTTVGATTDDADPAECGLGKQTVWYTFVPHAERVALRLRATGRLDAALGVIEQVRSQSKLVSCAQTTGGRDVASFDVHPKARYFIVVGTLRGSAPGPFSFDVLTARPRETKATRALPARGVRDSVNGLLDVNDMYFVRMTAGTTYRIAFRAEEPCPDLKLTVRRAGVTHDLGAMECSGYRTFTPGPDGGGVYTIEVVASPAAVTQPYRLQIAAAGPDDIGLGRELVNRVPAHGSLDPEGVDVVDLFHFDIARLSDVKLQLAEPAGASYKLALLTDTGAHVASGDTTLLRRLGIGRYVVAVEATPGSGGGGRYALSLLVRDLTATTLAVSGSTTGSTVTIDPGASVTLQVTTTPAAGGVEELEVDRFDPLTGWHFSRLIRVAAPTASVAWTPPFAGRWRVRASYRGSIASSPSRSGYVLIVVGKPPAPSKP